MCMSVKIWWSWLLHSMIYDSLSTFYLRAWLCFSLFSLFSMDLLVSTFFSFFFSNHGLPCVHNLFCIAHASFVRIMEKDHAWNHGVFIWWKWNGMFLLWALSNFVDLCWEFYHALKIKVTYTPPNICYTSTLEVSKCMPFHFHHINTPCLLAWPFSTILTNEHGLWKKEVLKRKEKMWTQEGP